MTQDHPDIIAALNETVARLTAENAAKDAQIQALQDKLNRANDALTQMVESRKEYYDV
jgi:outer membrane murein-binding lipoprotein Lpp